MIKKEDKQKPLTDSNIAKLFYNKGITIARRTITKYREQLNIPSTHQRKNHI